MQNRKSRPNPEHYCAYELGVFKIFVCKEFLYILRRLLQQQFPVDCAICVFWYQLMSQILMNNILIFIPFSSQ